MFLRDLTENGWTVKRLNKNHKNPLVKILQHISNMGQAEPSIKDLTKKTYFLSQVVSVRVLVTGNSFYLQNINTG